MQRKVYSLGLNMMILPVKVDIRKKNQDAEEEVAA
jgi:hypothetical protein